MGFAGGGADRDPLASVDMFAALDKAARDRLAESAVERRYRRGQVLFLEGDPGESLFVLRHGSVSVFRTAPNGERAMLTVVRAPEVLGEVALLDGAPRSASVEAMEDTVALTLSRASFLALFRTQPMMLDAVLKSFGALVRRLTDQTADHVFLDLPGRVAKTLVRLAGDSTDRPPTVDLPQGKLAEMVGGSRQSVNHAIGTFAARNWVRHEGRHLVLDDVPALRHRAGLDR
jgi:CRP/FNR family transcriptional regulator, cyclic AMP receptor protein